MCETRFNGHYPPCTNGIGSFRTIVVGVLAGLSWGRLWRTPWVCAFLLPPSPACMHCALGRGPEHHPPIGMRQVATAYM